MDDFALSRIDERLLVVEPESEIPEQVFSYDLDTNEKIACAEMKNKELGIGLKMSWNTDTLPIMTQWRSMRCGDYVMAIEPCTNYVYGRNKAKEYGKLRTIGPYEKVESEIRFTFYSI